MSAAAGPSWAMPKAIGTIVRQGITVNDVTVVEETPGQTTTPSSRSRSRTPQNHPVTVNFPPRATGNFAQPGEQLRRPPTMI